MRLTFARRHRTWCDRHHGERQGIARRRHADTGRRTRAEEITRGVKAVQGWRTTAKWRSPQPADATHSRS